MNSAFDPAGSAAAAFFETPIPAHDEPPLQPVRSRVVATWPAGTFVENIHARKDGSLIVSVHSACQLQRWTAEGGITVFASTPAAPTSINAHPSGGLVVCGGTPGSAPGYVWHIHDNGTVREILKLDDAVFLNGATPLSAGRFLTVDSFLGRLYHVDVEQRRASVWFEHDLLKKISAAAFLPGANGVKVFAGHVYVSNTDRAMFVCISINEDGTAGNLRVVAERLRADDFAFDINGVAYLTTHIHNSLLRLSPNGDRVNIGGAAQGLAGSTAAAFGCSDDDSRSIYVTTTGGVFAPIDGTVQPAKLVRLEVDEPGSASTEPR